MGVVRRTATSHKDYAAIWDYLAEHATPDVADATLPDLDDRVTLLSDNPGAGPARPELRPRVRSFPVGDYLWFYRPMRGGIELVRVVHVARHLRRLFRR